MPVVPPQGIILLTGANGYVASVTAKVLLDRGYRVRGTVRSVAKYDWMPSYFGPNFSLTEISDFANDHAFDEAVKGVDGVIHMAADVSFTHDPVVIEKAVKGVTNLMEAASKEPSVKRIVLTSAKAACANELPGVEYKITTETWNDEALEEVKKPAESHGSQQRSMLIYAAAKVQSERAAFEFVRKNKPHFGFSSVLPNVNFGPIVAIKHLGYPSSATLLNSLDKGYPLGPVFTPNQWFVNTEDTALLHLAALTLEEVQNERLLAMAEPFSWKRIVEILGRRFPERSKMVRQVDDAAVDIGHVDSSRAAEVLRLMGRDGFKSLEDSLIQGMQDIIAADSLPSVPRTGADDVIDMVFKRNASS